MSDEFSQGQSEAIRPLLFLLCGAALNGKQRDVMVNYIESSLLPQIRKHGSPQKVAGAESILLYLTSVLKDSTGDQEGAS